VQHVAAFLHYSEGVFTGTERVKKEEKISVQAT